MKTQHQKIVDLLKRRPKRGATYHDMQVECRINWPHKRISELESKGYRFAKQKENSQNGSHYLRFWLVDEPRQAA